MMKFKKLLSLFSLILVGGSAFADGTSLNCEGPIFTIADMDRVSCEIIQGVEIDRYSISKLSSPYATEFDRRELLIVHGKNSKLVKMIAGIKNESLQVQPALLHPPFEEQIVSRNFKKKMTQYRGWTVRSESIEYGSQSGIGFPFKCSTAYKSRSQKSVVVAECFSLEEEPRFFRALDLIH